MSYSESAYSELIEELFRKHQSVQASGFTVESYKPGLSRMLELDAALGGPSSRFKSVHVAGTNGKGSVCSLLTAALAMGASVGLYTSPHLLDFRERIKLVQGGSFSCISREEVWDFLKSHGDLLEGCSFFEITTAMAFWWFALQRVDVAVIETGLGGRLDSTNIITPELSIITSIGLDHCAILGDTRAKIAAEKAGIFKPGVPALVAARDPEIAPVFEAAARTSGSPLYWADAFDFPGAISADGIASLAAELDLQGPCQDVNLRTVLAALKILAASSCLPGSGAATGSIHPGAELASDGTCSGFTAVGALRHAAHITGFRGRWERLSETPEVIADIGHNPPALQFNFNKLHSLGRPLIIVYGVMADKDLAGIAPFMPSEATYILVSPATPRALPADALQDSLRKLRPDLDAVTAPDVATGVRTALDLALDATGPLIYIGGSTFVVAEALPLFA